MRQFEAVARKLRSLSEGLEAALDAGVLEAAEYAVQVARIIAPIDTGELRRGILAEPRGRLDVAVVSTAPHGAKLELGSAYTRPQPYLLPTARVVQDDFVRIAARALREVWK